MPIITDQPETVAELLDQLGGIPAKRVLLQPPPGTATEKDALRLIQGANKRLVELVDGTLVEKAMGAWESLIGVRLIVRLGSFIEEHDLGITLGADGMLRMSSGNVRLPDLSFIAWEDFPDEEVPEEAIWDITPTLTVEILSDSNTRREIDLKLQEYFDKGCKQSWIVDPEDQTVRVHTSVTVFTVLGPGGTLAGGDLLPGFSINLNEIFPSRRRKKK